MGSCLSTNLATIQQPKIIRKTHETAFSSPVTNCIHNNNPQIPKTTQIKILKNLKEEKTQNLNLELFPSWIVTQPSYLPLITEPQKKDIKRSSIVNRLQSNSSNTQLITLQSTLPEIFESGTQLKMKSLITRNSTKGRSSHTLLSDRSKSIILFKQRTEQELDQKINIGIRPRALTGNSAAFSSYLPQEKIIEESESDERAYNKSSSRTNSKSDEKQKIRISQLKNKKNGNLKSISEDGYSSSSESEWNRRFKQDFCKEYENHLEEKDKVSISGISKPIKKHSGLVQNNISSDLDSLNNLSFNNISQNEKKKKGYTVSKYSSLDPLHMDNILQVRRKNSIISKFRTKPKAVNKSYINGE